VSMKNTQRAVLAFANSGVARFVLTSKRLADDRLLFAAEGAALEKALKLATRVRNFHRRSAVV
jgi:hypothetical protein